MTSNIGSQWIQESSDYNEIKKKTDEALHAHFKPEFLNRIDEIIIFRRLEKEDLRKIIDIQLAALAARLAERKITFVLTDKAKDFISEQGYEPAFGARPLKRALQTFVLNPLSSKLIAGEFSEGDNVKIDISKSSAELIFKKL
jgi:ATP-dependent Clp protease ATP-binding subunit ClpB